MRLRAIAHLMIASLIIFSTCYAQEPSTVVEDHGIVGLGKRFVHDDAELWTTPLRIHREDLKWVVPFVVGAAALLKTDRSISAEIGEDKTEAFACDETEAAFTI